MWSGGSERTRLETASSLPSLLPSSLLPSFHTILASWASCFSLMSRLCSHQLTIHKELCASSRGIMTFHSSSIHPSRSLVSIFCSGAALPSGLLSHRAQSLAWQTRTTAGPIDKSPPAGTTEALGAFPSFSCFPHKSQVPHTPLHPYPQPPCLVAFMTWLCTHLSSPPLWRAIQTNLRPSCFNLRPGGSPQVHMPPEIMR